MAVKMDKYGVMLIVGSAVITGLIYLTGKASGKAETYGEIADVIKGVAEEIKNG